MDKINSEYIDIKVTKILQIYEENFSNIETMFNNNIQNSIYTKYSSGSDMHLGYYCPSPIYEITTSGYGTHRGRILKRNKRTEKTDHKYFFDKNNKLIMIRGYTKVLENKRGDTIDLIFNENNEIKTLSFQVYKDTNIIINKNIDDISYSIFKNGKITEYCVAYFNNIEINKIQELYFENYFYDKNNTYVNKAICIECTYPLKSKITRGFIFTFYLNTQNKLICDQNSSKEFYKKLY